MEARSRSNRCLFQALAIVVCSTFAAGKALEASTDIGLDTGGITTANPGAFRALPETCVRVLSGGHLHPRLLLPSAAEPGGCFRAGPYQTASHLLGAIPCRTLLPSVVISAVEVRGKPSRMSGYAPNTGWAKATTRQHAKSNALELICVLRRSPQFRGSGVGVGPEVAL
jgi:hypothetical protein